MATKIFVMTHTKFKAPNDKAYIPLHVGREGKPDLGYLGDNTGENLSDLNCYYGELTGVYWVWNNYKGDENIGICHYRRFFIDEQGYRLEEEDFNRILKSYDIITSNCVDEGVPYYEYFGAAHNVRDLELEGEVIKEMYPEYYDSFVECMSGTKHYFGNLMVTSRALFDEYCLWLFSIFAELCGRLDISGYDDYHKRIFGFLSEQLLMVWVKARGLKVYEGRVGIFEEKAETRDLKAAIGFLIRDKKFTEAAELFKGVLAVRPDVALELSDVKGELPIIGEILNILIEEDKEGHGKYIDYSDDLVELIAFHREQKNEC